jgi:hypothetical protein
MLAHQQLQNQKDEKKRNVNSDSAEATVAEFQVWIQKNDNKNEWNFNQSWSHLGPATSWELEEWWKWNVNSQTTLKQDWAQFQVWIQKIRKKNFENSIKTGATLAQKVVGN